MVAKINFPNQEWLLFKNYDDSSSDMLFFNHILLFYFLGFPHGSAGKEFIGFISNRVLIWYFRRKEGIINCKFQMQNLKLCLYSWLQLYNETKIFSLSSKFYSNFNIFNNVSERTKDCIWILLFKNLGF